MDTLWEWMLPEEQAAYQAVQSNTEKNRILRLARDRLSPPKPKPKPINYDNTGIV